MAQDLESRQGAGTGDISQVLPGLSPAKGILVPVGEGPALPLPPVGIFAPFFLSLLILGAKTWGDPGPA